MPKLVDHDERRHEIARALWSVVARGGFEAASARTVAAEGDWSLGALRHYFSSQDELVEFAARELIDGAAARIATVLETMPAGLPRCRMALEQLLPLDDVRRGEVRAWLAILVKAEVSPSLAELREVALDGERQLCRLVVAELSGHPYPTSPSDWPAALEYAAVDLHAWIDGHCLQAASSRQLLPADAARAALDRYLRQLSVTVAQLTT